MCVFELFFGETQMRYPDISLKALSVAVLGAFSVQTSATDFGSQSTFPSSSSDILITEETINITADEYWSFTSDGKQDNRYVSVLQTGKKIQLSGNEINITTPNLSIDGVDCSSIGVYQTGDTSVLEIGNSDSLVSIQTTSTKKSSGLVASYGSSTKIDGRTILLNVESTNGGESRGVEADPGGTIILGTSSTELIDINVSGNSGSMGIFALGGGTSDPNNGGSIVISSQEFRLTTNGTFGIHSQNSTQTDTAPDKTASIIINAGKTTIRNTAETGIGLSAFSNGYLEVNGDLSVEAAHAIDARGNSTILINKDKTGIVTLKGDIVFETPNQKPDGDSNNSGDKINANVTVNLSEGSSWTGRAYQSYPVQIGGQWVENKTVALEDENRSEYYGFVTGFSVNIDNGGVWNMTGDSFVNNASVNGGVINVSAEAKTVNAAALDLNGGIVNMQGSADQKLNVVTLTGTGGTVNVTTTANEDGTFTTPLLHVETVESAADVPTTLAMYYAGITADDLSADAAADLEKIAAQSLSLGEGESVAQIRTVDEGNIRGAVIQNVNEAGEVTDTNVAANTKLTNFSSVNAMSLVQWRNEINHLTKRLGDIRASDGTIGAWARVYGGESQWGGSNEVEMDHTTIQVGGDYRINDHWIAGGAFSYTDSDADFSNGAADGESYSLAAYATYMADGGSFLDLIARYGYLKNDVTAGNMGLDTSSSAFSLSAEMGHTFRFVEDRAYVEPQVEFTYGFISGDDATASNGVRIDQDDFQSFVTRVGVRAGYDFPEKKGSFYGMLSYSYDWMGDADGVASQNGLSANMNEDLGGGWVTYGIGAQFMMGKSAYLYGELERTSGGDIDNPYLFSAGFRMTF